MPGGVVISFPVTIALLSVAVFQCPRPSHASTFLTPHIPTDGKNTTVAIQAQCPSKDPLLTTSSFTADNVATKTRNGEIDTMSTMEAKNSRRNSCNPEAHNLEYRKTGVGFFTPHHLCPSFPSSTAGLAPKSLDVLIVYKKYTRTD
jgi:hypothetical protein